MKIHIERSLPNSPGSRLHVWFSYIISTNLNVATNFTLFTADKISNRYEPQRKLKTLRNHIFAEFLGLQWRSAVDDYEKLHALVYTLTFHIHINCEHWLFYSKTIHSHQNPLLLLENCYFFQIRGKLTHLKTHKK